MSIIKHEDKYLHITKGTAVAISVGILWAFIVISGLFVLIEKLRLNHGTWHWYTFGCIPLIVILLLSMIIIPIYIKYNGGI